MIYTENSSFLGHDFIYIGIWVPNLGYPKDGRNQFPRNFSTYIGIYRRLIPIDWIFASRIVRASYLAWLSLFWPRRRRTAVHLYTFLSTWYLIACFHLREARSLIDSHCVLVPHPVTIGSKWPGLPHHTYLVILPSQSAAHKSFISRGWCTVTR